MKANIKHLVFLIILLFSSTHFLSAQNVGINTDGTVAETGVMLDVKGINSHSVTATQNIFQVKSYDAS